MGKRKGGREREGGSGKRAKEGKGKKRHQRNEKGKNARERREEKKERKGKEQRKLKKGLRERNYFTCTLFSQVGSFQIRIKMSFVTEPTLIVVSGRLSAAASSHRLGLDT